MSSVFISYSSEDRPVARRIAADLQSRGVRVWLDEYEILPGDRIVDKIAEGIRRSEYLIVLISKNTVGSTWIRREFEIAFERNREASERRLIPVRIDDSAVPPYLAAVRYIDLRPDYSVAIDQLAQSVVGAQSPETPAVSALVDAEELARHLKEEQRNFRGAGSLITTSLGALTILVAIIAAIPAFQEGFGNQPRVYYAVSVDQLGLPSSIDGARVQELLKQNRIPGSTVRVGIINKGDAAAKLVKAGVQVPGNIDTPRTDPPPEPEPVWVSIEIEHDPKKSPSHVRFTLTDLVPNHRLNAEAPFYGDTSGASPLIDVVADGKPAIRISSLELAPDWSLWVPFELPLRILGWGLLLTLAAGLAVIVAASPRTREAFLLLVKELNPTLARLVDLLIRTAR